MMVHGKNGRKDGVLHTVCARIKALLTLHTRRSQPVSAHTEGLRLYEIAKQLLDRGHDTLLACKEGMVVQFTLAQAASDEVTIVHRIPKAGYSWGNKAMYVALLCSVSGTIDKRIITERQRLSDCVCTQRQVRLVAHEASELCEMLTAYSRQLVSA